MSEFGPLYWTGLSAAFAVFLFAMTAIADWVVQKITSILKVEYRKRVWPIVGASFLLFAGATSGLGRPLASFSTPLGAHTESLLVLALVHGAVYLMQLRRVRAARLAQEVRP